MKIASIALKDFRIYQEASIAFDEPLSVIRGANHQGKSSIAQAIQLSLSRRSEGTDPRGAGANDKIRTGASKAVINLRVSGKSGVIDLRTTYGPNKTNRQQSVTVPDSDDSRVAQGFEKYLETNIDRLACVLDSDFFTSPKTDQKAILAALVLPTTHAFDPAMVAMAEKWLGKFEWNKPPVAVIDQVYAAAYDGRKSAKAALNAIYIPEQPQTPAYDVATINETLADLRAKAAKEARKRPAGGGQVARLELALESAQKRLQLKEAELNDAHEQLSIANAKLLETPALNKLVKVAAGRAQFNALEEKIEETVRDIDAQKQAQAIYLELIEDEDGNRLESPCCPTCTQAITLDFVEAKVAVHKQLENEAIELQLSLMSQQKELGDITGAEAKIAANNEQAEAKKRLQTSIQQISSDVASLKQEVFTTDISLKEAQKIEVPAVVDTTELDALNEKIAQWEQHLRPAVQYESTLKQIEKATEQKKEKQAEVSDLETLCSHFGKDGVKATLIGQHVGAFTATINRVLKVWGYQATLSIDPYEFIVNTKNGNLPLKELSGSERLMFGIALQTAIAVHSKIKMVVIDRGDTFINGERGRLFSCLLSLLQDQTLEQAIVLLSDDRSEAPKQAGAAFYRVADGKVARL